jgi:hypothetical protein
MISATAKANFLACQHIATLDCAEARKEIKKPFFKDPTVDLLQKLGLEHEQRYLRQLAERDGLAIVEIDVSGSWENAVAETTNAIRRGVDAVYQRLLFSTVLGVAGPISLFASTLPAPSGLGRTRWWKLSSHAAPRQEP